MECKAEARKFNVMKSNAKVMQSNTNVMQCNTKVMQFNTSVVQSNALNETRLYPMKSALLCNGKVMQNVILSQCKRIGNVM